MAVVSDVPVETGVEIGRSGVSVVMAAGGVGVEHETNMPANNTMHAKQVLRFITHLLM
jgi:hypothetical protein